MHLGIPLRLEVNRALIGGFFKASILKSIGKEWRDWLNTSFPNVEPAPNNTLHVGATKPRLVDGGNQWIHTAGIIIKRGALLAQIWGYELLAKLWVML